MIVVGIDPGKRGCATVLVCANDNVQFSFFKLELDLHDFFMRFAQLVISLKLQHGDVSIFVEVPKAFLPMGTKRTILEQGIGIGMCLAFAKSLISKDVFEVEPKEWSSAFAKQKHKKKTTYSERKKQNVKIAESLFGEKIHADVADSALIAYYGLLKKLNSKTHSKEKEIGTHAQLQTNLKKTTAKLY